MQGVALPAELLRLSAQAGFEPATHEVTLVYGTTSIPKTSGRKAAGDLKMYSLACYPFTIPGLYWPEKQDSNLQLQYPDEVTPAYGTAHFKILKAGGQQAARDKAVGSLQDLNLLVIVRLHRSTTHLRHLLLIYKSTASMVSRAVPPFSIASSTSNILSLQPAMRKTSSCSRLIGEAP